MTVSREDVARIFPEMQERFDAQKAEGLDAVIQFDLSGESGSAYWVHINNGAVSYEEGEAEEPRVTLMADAADYVAVVKGEMNPMQAFMQGKIKVKGDMSLALKLQGIFNL